MPDFTTDLSKYRILAIDDEPDNLEVLRTTLEVMHSAVVCVAGNCQQALARLETFQPTVIITDISMPQIDGFSLLKLLRERPDTRDLPIIALTAHAMRGDRERILSAGFDGYIGKPFEILTLGAELERQLGSFTARQPPNLNAVVAVPEPTPQLPLPVRPDAQSTVSVGNASARTDIAIQPTGGTSR